MGESNKASFNMEEVNSAIDLIQAYREKIQNEESSGSISLDLKSKKMEQVDVLLPVKMKCPVEVTSLILKHMNHFGFKPDNYSRLADLSKLPLKVIESAAKPERIINVSKVIQLANYLKVGDEVLQLFKETGETRDSRLIDVDPKVVERYVQQIGLSGSGMPVDVIRARWWRIWDNKSNGDHISGGQKIAAQFIDLLVDEYDLAEYFISRNEVGKKGKEVRMIRLNENGKKMYQEILSQKSSELQSQQDLFSDESNSESDSVMEENHHIERLDVNGAARLICENLRFHGPSTIKQVKDRIKNRVPERQVINGALDSLLKEGRITQGVGTQEFRMIEIVLNEDEQKEMEKELNDDTIILSMINCITMHGPASLSMLKRQMQMIRVSPVLTKKLLEKLIVEGKVSVSGSSSEPLYQIPTPAPAATEQTVDQILSSDRFMCFNIENVVVTLDEATRKELREELKKTKKKQVKIPSDSFIAEHGNQKEVRISEPVVKMDLMKVAGFCDGVLRLKLCDVRLICESVGRLDLLGDAATNDEFECLISRN